MKRHTLTRRTALGLLAFAPLAACRPAAPPPPDPLTLSVERACAWLATAQVADGRIPSSTYGFMRVGHSTTAFIALALGGLGGRLPQAALATQGRALDWLASGLATGPLGFAGPALDYPVYATSIGISALLASKRTEGLELAVAWLLDQQLVSGWEDHGARGGFAMGRAPGTAPPQPPHPGHVDLSMTRRALQAMAAALDAGIGDSTRLQAGLAHGAAFTRRCRTSDGGFVYSPAELALNKSALVEGVQTPETSADFRGYGSATADGVLALQATGVARTHSDVLAGLRWLEQHHSADLNPGLDGAPIAAYAQAMRFYYRSASAEALSRGGPAGWADAMVAAILAEQQPEGFWKSETALQKEDDPVVATGLALIALGFAGG